MLRSTSGRVAAVLCGWLFAVSSFAAEPVTKREPAGADLTEAPGCAVETARRACLADSGNAADLERCMKPASEGANAELRRVMDAITPAVRDDAALLNALAAAQMSWQTWVQRDCDAVGADFQDGALKAGQVAACVYGHTLERAQALWSRHLKGYEGVVPAGCRASW